MPTELRDELLTTQEQDEVMLGNWRSCLQLGINGLGKKDRPVVNLSPAEEALERMRIRTLFDRIDTG